VELTSHLSPEDRERVEARLHRNLMAWLTTVRPDGQPVSVPVWFVLREDGTILVYSRPSKAKLRNIVANPKVCLGLDVTDIGRNIVRVEGTARHEPDLLPAHREPAYLAKYVERMGAMFDTPESFGEQFTAALIITPTKVHA
jgi:PPOX class probable F420-dependent enzyme